MKPGFAAGLFAVAGTLFAAGAVFAKDYPAKPIRMVVTGVGSGGDFGARLIALGVSPALGQQIIVDNRGSGDLPAKIVSKSPPDGCTLCLPAAPLWITPFLRRAEVKEKFFAAGMEPLGSPPETLAATVKSEMNRLGKVIKGVGIALEP